jgi:hypothetical protein
MSESTIHLELSVAEVNLILEALGEQPFKSVFTLVSRLQSQAREQLQGQSNGAVTPEVVAEAGEEP